MTHLEGVGQAEAEGREPGIEERHPALDPVRHQAAIELGEQVVRQPVGAIGGLRRLQRGAPAARRLDFGRGDAGTPIGRGRAQDIEPVERAFEAHRPAEQEPRTHGAAVAAVTGENLVAALARENHLEPGRARRLAELERRQHRVVGAKIVHRRHDLGQKPPEVAFVELDLDMLGAGGLGDGAGVRALVRRKRAGKGGGEGDHRLGIEPRHHREQDRGIDAAREEHAVRHVGALVQLDRFVEITVQVHQGVFGPVLLGPARG